MALVLKATFFKARYAAGVMSKRIQLPSKSEMEKHWKKSMVAASDPTGGFTFKVSLKIPRHETKRLFEIIIF